MTRNGNKLSWLFFLSLLINYKAEAQVLPFTYKEFFWFDKEVAPDAIPFDPSVNYSIIYANDIKFNKSDYNYSKGNCPKNIIIIANTIRLAGVVNFDLSPKSWGINRVQRSGGNIYIIAQNIVYDYGAFLEINSKGYYWDGRPPADVVVGETGGNGGQIFTIYDKEILTDQEITAVTLAQQDFFYDFFFNSFKIGTPITTEFRVNLKKSIKEIYSDEQQKNSTLALLDSKTLIDSTTIKIMVELQILNMIDALKMHNTPLNSFSLALESVQISGGPGGGWNLRGKDGEYKKIKNISSSYNEIAFSKQVISKWTINYLDNLRLRINLALTQHNKTGLFDLFNEYSKFVYHDIDQAFHNQLNESLEFINTKRDQTILPLNIKKISVDHINEVFVVSEGIDKKYYLMPTNILINDFTVNQDKKLGFHYSSNNQVQVSYYFTGKLTVDPKVLNEIENTLQKEHLQYDGIFTNLSYDPKQMINIDGFDKDDSYIKVSGLNIEGKLVVNTNTKDGLMNLTFLGREHGIQIPLKWEYSKDRDYQKMHYLTLSFAKRSSNNIIINVDSVFNSNSSKALIYYYINSSNKIIRLASPLEVSPKSKLSLSKLNNDTPKFIPPEAISFPLSSSELMSQFSPISHDNFVKNIIIKNSLPNTIDGYNVKGIQLTLTYNLDDTNIKSIKVDLGRHSDEKTLNIYYPSDSNLVISVTGTVILDNGTHSLKTTTFSTRIVDIKTIMLQ